jgi:hypothetical protein
LFNEAASTAIKLEQRFHFSTQLFIAGTCLIQEGSALALSQLQRRLTNPLDLLPTVSHKNSDE